MAALQNADPIDNAAWTFSYLWRTTYSTQLNFWNFEIPTTINFLFNSVSHVLPEKKAALVKMKEMFIFNFILLG